MARLVQDSSDRSVPDVPSVEQDGTESSRDHPLRRSAARLRWVPKATKVAAAAPNPGGGGDSGGGDTQEVVEIQEKDYKNLLSFKPAQMPKVEWDEEQEMAFLIGLDGNPIYQGGSYNRNGFLTALWSPRPELLAGLRWDTEIPFLQVALS